MYRDEHISVVATSDFNSLTQRYEDIFVARQACLESALSIDLSGQLASYHQCDGFFSLTTGRHCTWIVAAVPGVDNHNNIALPTGTQWRCIALCWYGSVAVIPGL